MPASLAYPCAFSPEGLRTAFTPLGYNPAASEVPPSQRPYRRDHYLMKTIPATERYLLNCFAVEFSVPSITVAHQPWTHDTDMRELRRSLGDDWFILRRGDRILGLPTVSNPSVGFGQGTTVLSLDGYEGIDFMKARLDAALPTLLPKYQPERVRPFRFLAQKDEFVSTFAAGRDLPGIVRQGFAVRPRFELEARTVEMIEGELRVVVAMSVAMQWEISPTLSLGPHISSPRSTPRKARSSFTR